MSSLRPNGSQKGALVGRTTQEAAARLRASWRLHQVDLRLLLLVLVLAVVLLLPLLLPSLQTPLLKLLPVLVAACGVRVDAALPALVGRKEQTLR